MIGKKIVKKVVQKVGEKAVQKGIQGEVQKEKGEEKKRSFWEELKEDVDKAFEKHEKYLTNDPDLFTALAAGFTAPVEVVKVLTSAAAKAVEKIPDPKREARKAAKEVVDLVSPIDLDVIEPSSEK